MKSVTPSHCNFKLSFTTTNLLQLKISTLSFIYIFNDLSLYSDSNASTTFANAKPLAKGFKIITTEEDDHSLSQHSQCWRVASQRAHKTPHIHTQHKTIIQATQTQHGNHVSFFPPPLYPYICNTVPSYSPTPTFPWELTKHLHCTVLTT